MQIRCATGANVFSLLLSNWHESIARAFSKHCVERAGMFLEWRVAHVRDACISTSSFSAVPWIASHSHELRKMHITFLSLFCTDSLLSTDFINCTETELHFLLVSASNKVLCYHVSALQSWLCIKMKKKKPIFAFKVLRYSTSLRWELLAGSEVNQWRSPQAEQGMASRGGQGGPSIVERMNVLGEMQWVLLHICIVSKVVICLGIFFLHYCLELPPHPGILLVASLTFFALLFKPLLALLTSACCSPTFASVNIFSHFTLTFFFPHLRPSPINCSSSSSASELQQRWILLFIPSLKYASVFWDHCH